MKTISLLGSWSLSPAFPENCPKEFSKTIPISFPGDIHSALLAQKLIPDPYYGMNELEVQWVGRTAWKCSKIIQIGENFLKGKQFITLENADTFVTVFINDIEVGKCSNQFCLWRFEITAFVKKGFNTITLLFEPSEKYALEAAKKLPYPIPCSIYDISSPNRNLVRKTQCHAGWDWGPCIMAMGIYDSIRLEQTTTAFIDYINCVTTPINNSSKWNAHLVLSYTGIKNNNSTVDISLQGPDIDPISFSEKCNFTTGENTLEFDFEVENPSLWYAAGTNPIDEKVFIETGKVQNTENILYTLSVSIGQQKIEKLIGFRTLQVVAEEDEHGKSLYFKVNGRSIFAKGSNWIPSDALPARMTEKKTAYLLDSLIASNQNMVRVWGGGQYESNFFYTYCDKKGILVWQDCMFACSTYPSNPEFLESVRKEIQHQVKRIQYHPSLAIWCGNNEDLGALTWYEESKNNRDPYVIDYDRLNEGVLGTEIQKLDPERAWWPSSPSAGPNDFSDNWHSDGRGDMHFWSVWHEKKSFDAYQEITPRFVSEFGYQSMSSVEEVKTFAPNDQLNLTSPTMEFHQRSPGGNSIILENFSRYFRFPSGFENICYLSQVQQALAIKTAVQYWRSLRPICMGAIYWQLNDVWPVVSWSSIEYSGKWKLLHYAAKSFFAPIATFLYKKNNTIHAVVANDTATDIKGIYSLTVFDFNGNIIDKKKMEVNCTSDSVNHVFQISEEKLPVLPKDCFIRGKLVLNNGNVFTDYLFLTPQKKCDLQKPHISVTVNTDLSVTLETDKPAFYVSLETKRLPGIFSDNMITLLPGKPVTLQFTPKKTDSVNSKMLSRSLRIKSLRDTY